MSFVFIFDCFKQGSLQHQQYNYMHILKKISSAVFSKSNPKAKKETYRIGDYEIAIPPGFGLPSYQKHHKLYDRFLPVLAKHLPAGKLIIDVGANIGDTAVAMLQHCTNPVLCIEPSAVFFSYLEDNLKRIKATDAARVTTCKAMVGTGGLKGELSHNNAGTAGIKLMETLTEPTHIPLDTIVEDKAHVALVKVDTDGYDFDVIRSAEAVCTEAEPLLFWENEIAEDFQYNDFNELYKWLTVKGYKYIYVFDNFGNLMSVEQGFDTLQNLNAYIYSMKKSGCTRTIYYTDVLAATEKYHHVAANAIAEYQKDWINK